MKTRVKLTATLAATFGLAAVMVLPALAQNNGADIYRTKCQMCHGSDGTANTPAGKAIKAASFKSPAAKSASDADLIAIIHNGKGRMPSYAGKLSDAQIKAAVGYIRTLQK